jgi:hypothetical protein
MLVGLMHHVLCKDKLCVFVGLVHARVFSAGQLWTSALLAKGPDHH